MNSSTRYTRYGPAIAGVATTRYTRYGPAIAGVATTRYTRYPAIEIAGSGSGLPVAGVAACLGRHAYPCEVTS